MGGNITNHVAAWKKLTGDKFIIDIVTHGLRLNFTDGCPTGKPPFEYPRSKKEFEYIDTEVRILLNKCVISPSPYVTGDYFSNLFTRT